MDVLAEQLDTLVSMLTTGTEQFGRFAANVRTGAEATADASRSLQESTRTLVEATPPVRESVDKLQVSTDQMVRSTRHVAENTRANADSVKQALDAANEALGGSQSLLGDTLREFRYVVDAMRGQGERLDDVDAKLGQAFETYRSNVQAWVDSLDDHVRRVQGELTPALDTMREITERQEEFRPSIEGSLMRAEPAKPHAQDEDESAFVSMTEFKRSASSSSSCS